MDAELSLTTVAPRDRDATAERAHEATRALARYTSALAHGRDVGAARDEARDAMSRYVEILRAARVAPERALVTVKIVAHSLALDLGIRQRESIVDETVRWCIGAYYGETADRQPVDQVHRVD